MYVAVGFTYFGEEEPWICEVVGPFETEKEAEQTKGIALYYIVEKLSPPKSEVIHVVK